MIALFIGEYQDNWTRLAQVLSQSNISVKIHDNSQLSHELDLLNIDYMKVKPI